MRRTYQLLTVPVVCGLVSSLAAAAFPAAARDEPGAGAVRAGAASAGPAARGDDLRLPAGGALVGRWSVRHDDRGGGAVVVWRSAEPVPVTDARPELRVGGRVVAYPSPSPDGRALSVPLAAVAGVDLSRVQLWLGPDRLDRAGPVAASLLAGGAGPGPAGAAAERVRVLPVDPGRPGPFDVQAPFGYRAPGLDWPEFGAPMEVLGHVVMPVGVADAPLVLFLHGRHTACYRPGARDRSSLRVRDWPCPGAQRPVPSHLGYEYVQRLLATQGYASVSISANAVNAQDYVSPDGGAAARSALVRHHLGLIARWAASPARPRWEGRVDVDETVLVGHSRGGEGVATAVVDTPPGAPWDVRGQVLVAPTNFARRSTPYTPSVTLLPYCDGDVFDLQGQQYTDLPRDLTTDDTALHSSVLMRGANHNFFNTEWTPGLSAAPSFDDWFDRDDPLCGRQAPTRLSAQQQRAAGRAWIAGAVRLFASGDTEMLAMYDTAGLVTVASAAAAAVRTHALGANRTLVRPGDDAVPVGRGRLCRAVEGGTGPPAACGAGVGPGRRLHWLPDLPGDTPVPRELTSSWRAAAPAGGLDLAAPLDLTGAVLDLRTIVEPTSAPVRLRVRLTDADGDTWTAPAQVLAGLRGGGSLRTYWAQTLRVGTRAAPARLDLGAVTGVGLVAVSRPGRVWVVDLSARRPGLLPVPDTRLPSLDLGDPVVVDEGDDPDATATVGYTLDRPAPADADLVVGTTSYTSDVVEGSVDVRVPEGATEGTFEVPVAGNDVDSVRRLTIGLQAYALDGIVVGDGAGRVVVRDDDPDARLRVRPVAAAVDAGAPMLWRALLDRPVDYVVYVGAGGVVTDPRRGNLRVSDVPARWARRHLGGGLAPTMPVARRFFGLVVLGPARPSGTIRVPTVADPPRPGQRSLTLRFAHDLLPGGPVQVSIRRR